MKLKSEFLSEIESRGFIYQVSDIKQLGIFETSEKHIKIIEWPELIKPKPKNRIEIFLKYLKQINARKVKINGFGKWKSYEFFKI